MPAAYAAVLDAAHGHIKAVVDEKRGIDHGGAGFDLPRNLTGPPFSASPDRSIQTKFGVICPSNGLVGTVHGVKSDDGPERLFSGNRHHVINVREDCRFNKTGSQIRAPFPSHQHACSLIDRALDAAEDSVRVRSADQASHIHVP